MAVPRGDLGVKHGVRRHVRISHELRIAIRWSGKWLCLFPRAVPLRSGLRLIFLLIRSMRARGKS